MQSCDGCTSCCLWFPEETVVQTPSKILRLAGFICTRQTICLNKLAILNIYLKYTNYIISKEELFFTHPTNRPLESKATYVKQHMNIWKNKLLFLYLPSFFVMKIFCFSFSFIVLYILDPFQCVGLFRFQPLPCLLTLLFLWGKERALQRKLNRWE